MGRHSGIRESEGITLGIEDLTSKQKLFLLSFTFISISSIFIIGLILDALVYCFSIFVAFVIVNVYVEKHDKKEHAPAIQIGILKIETIYMCYLVSNFMFLLCMVIMKYSAESIGRFQAGALGVILIAFASVILSGIFYWKPKGESNYKILLDYIKFNGITDEVIEAEILLKKRVSAQEYILYKRILIDGCGSSAAWNGAELEFDVHREKIKQALDKCYCYMIGRLNL